MAETTTLAGLSAEFAYRGKWARQRSLGLAYQFGKALIEQARQNASGRPGPEVVSGRYIDSFSSELYEGPLWTGVHVGTDRPYGMRLEYGFDGTDALGREVHAPPFPHWGPAADVVGAQFMDSMELLADLDVTPAAG